MTVLFGPDGRPLVKRDDSGKPITQHRFVKIEPVRRRPKRHKELRWYCLCGALGPMLVRPESISDCQEHPGELCWTYRYQAGVAIVRPKLAVHGHFETTDPWRIAGKGPRAIFGEN